MVSISTINSAAQTQSASNTASTVVATATTAKTATLAPTISTTNSSTVKVSSAALMVAKAATASTVTVSVADVLKAGYTPLANTVIKDTAANIQTNLKAIAAITPAANITGITLSDTAKATISVARADVSGDLSVPTNSDPEVLLLKKITTAYNLSVTGLAVSDALTLQSTGTSATLTMSVSDTASNLSTNLDALQTKVKAKSITALNLTADPAQTSKPMLSMTAKQLTADVDALASLKGDFDLTVTGVLAADALKTAGAADAALKKSGSTSTLSKITIADTSANITKSIATLETAATAGRLSSITVTDNAALNLTEAQALADADVLKVQFTTQTKLNITNMAAKDVGATSSITKNYLPDGTVGGTIQFASKDGQKLFGNFDVGNTLERSFVIQNGNFNAITPPDLRSIHIYGITPDGTQAYGWWQTNNGWNNAFVISKDGSVNWINVGLPRDTGISGISNDGSKIFGSYYIPPPETKLLSHAYILDNGSVNKINPFNANQSSIEGISDNGDTYWGIYLDSNNITKNFIYKNGNFTDVSFSDAVHDPVIYVNGVSGISIGESDIKGISGDGSTLYGSFKDNSGGLNAFIYKNGSRTIINPPNSKNSTISKISSDGSFAVGNCISNSGNKSAFIYKNGISTELTKEGINNIQVGGFTTDNTVWGTYKKNDNNTYFFTCKNGIFNEILPEGSENSTLQINGVIDDGSMIYGSYNKNGKNIAFTTKIANDPITSILPTNSNLKLNSETVTDTAANISANLDNIQAAVKAKTVTAITVSDKNPITVSGAAAVTNHAEALAAITNAYTLNVDKLSAADAIAIKSPSSKATLSLAVTDTAANIAANLDKLQAMVKAKTLSAITVSDSATPITITAAQLTADTDVLKLLTNSGGLSVTGVLAADAAKTVATVGVKTIAIADSAANILKSATALKTLAASNKITSILINDKTPPTAKIADVLAMQDIGVQDTHGVEGVKYNIADTASNIIAHTRFDIGDVLKNAKLISITDTKAPVLTLADAQTLTSITKLDPKTKYSVADGGAAIATQAAISGEKVLSGAQAVTINKNYTVAQAKSVLALKNLDKNNAYAITDTVANILAESKISGSKVLAGGTAVNVSDTMANIFTNADDLELLAKSGQISDINPTDEINGNADVSQLWTDAEMFGKLTGNTLASRDVNVFKTTTNGIANYGVTTNTNWYAASLHQPFLTPPKGFSTAWIGNDNGFYNLQNDKSHFQLEIQNNNSTFSKSDVQNLLNQFMTAKSPQEFQASMKFAKDNNVQIQFEVVLDNPTDVYGNGNLSKNVQIPVNYNSVLSDQNQINFSLNSRNWINVSILQPFVSIAKVTTSGWGPLSPDNKYTITGNEIGHLSINISSLNSTNLNYDVTKFLAGLTSAKSPQEFDIAYKNAQSNAATNTPPFNLFINFGINSLDTNSGFNLAYGGISADGKNILMKSALSP